MWSVNIWTLLFQGTLFLLPIRWDFMWNGVEFLHHHEQPRRNKENNSTYKHIIKNKIVEKKHNQRDKILVNWKLQNVTQRIHTHVWKEIYELGYLLALRC